MEAPVAVPETPGRTAPLPARAAFVAAVWIVFGFVAGVSLMNLRYAVVFEQLQMKELPLPTEAVLAASAFCARGPGAPLLAILAGVASFFALRGTWDRRLLALTFGILLAGLLFAWASIGLVYPPVIKINVQTLSR